MIKSLRLRAAIVSVVILIITLGTWELANQPPRDQVAMSEYELLMGGASQEARVPPPSQVIALAIDELSKPFYDNGPNDKGIGIQLGYSIFRVMSGFLLAAAIAIPLGFLIGMSEVMQKALNPFIEAYLSTGLDAIGAIRHQGF